MNEYIHHVPGRLRLRMTQIKKQPKRAQEIQAAICRISGVASVDANTVTGSLVIRYDTDAVEVETILKSMREAGLISGAADRSEPQYRSSASPITGKVVDVLVEKLIARSALALVGALF